MVIKHLLGLMIFSIVMLFTVFVENIEKFPSLAAKLPMRYVVTTKNDVKLYSTEYENDRKKAIGVLRSGETVDFQAWVCPYKKIKLSSGKQYLILAGEDEIEIKLLKFYYF